MKLSGFLLLCLVGMGAFAYWDSVALADDSDAPKTFIQRLTYKVSGRQALKTYCKQYASTKRFGKRRAAERNCMANPLPLEERGRYQRDNWQQRYDY